VTLLVWRDKFIQFKTYGSKLSKNLNSAMHRREEKQNIRSLVAFQRTEAVIHCDLQDLLNDEIDNQRRLKEANFRPNDSLDLSVDLKSVS